MISSSSFLSLSGNTAAKFQRVFHLNRENERMCRWGQPHTPLHIKIHLKLIPSNWFGCLQTWAETCNGLGFISILALCTYSLLFPLRFSPLSASPHLMLWVPVEKSLLLFPLGSIFSSRSLPHRWCTCFTDVPAERGFFFFPPSALWHPSTPLRLRSRFWAHHWSGWTTPRERRSGGVEKERGVGGGCGWIRDSQKKPEVFPRSRSGTG